MAESGRKSVLDSALFGRATFLAKDLGDADSSGETLAPNERLMADQRMSNTGCASSCALVSGMVGLFWFGSSAYLAYSNSLSAPIEGVPDIGSFIWYFFVSFIMAPVVLFCTPEG